jgi:hypothetical protein
MPEMKGPDSLFMELASRFLDGEATPEELESLNEIIQKDSLALDALGELLNQHGTLAWMQRGRASFKGRPSSEALAASGRDTDSAPRRVWWIAIPLAACLLVTVGIIRFAPMGTLPPPQVNPAQAPAAIPEWQTLSFQDGNFPSKDYRGTRDTQLMEREASKPWGSDRLIEVEGESGGRPALLSWDLRQIPPGSKVISVSLALNVIDVSGDRECEAYMLTRPWVESQANWVEYASSRRWEVPGGKGGQDRDSRILARFQPARGVVTIPLNETGVAVVQRWVNSDGSNHGLLLKMTDRVSEFTFYSRESDIASQRPKLTVNYRPAVK